MKRSLINQNITLARKLLEENKITLPNFGYWSMDEWKANKSELFTVKSTMLGWDVTDFGCKDFNTIGGVLFTIRNGSFENKALGTPYAEKYIVLQPGQKLPMHMHKTKSEDIINRCGGNYCIKLYNTAQGGGIDYESDVEVYCDGIKKHLKAGEILEITTGNSITLRPYLYHSFWGKETDAPSIIGEVSSINDDNTDNNFADEVNRFTKIEEDEAILCPLCNEYGLLD